MVEYELKGLFNQNTLSTSDISNNNNYNNQQLFDHIIRGNANSEMLTYLLNMNHQRLNDFKSMHQYNYGNFASLMNSVEQYNEIENDETILLPKPLRIKNKLQQVLKKRKSVRNYIGLSCDLRELSTILMYSFGISGRKENFGGIVASMRYYASGGALYPISVIIYINEVDGLKKGLYLYQPMYHSLLPLNIKTQIDINKLFVGSNIDVKNSSFFVFYKYAISSTYLKYGELSLANILIEAGMMAQNFSLVTTACGFGSCPIAGYNKRFIEDICNLDHVNEHIIFTESCGRNE